MKIQRDIKHFQVWMSFSGSKFRRQRKTCQLHDIESIVKSFIGWKVTVKQLVYKQYGL